MNMTVGPAIKSVRESKGLTQREASKVLGVSETHLSLLENGKNRPSLGLVEKIAEAWGVDVYVYAWCLSGDASKLPAKLQPIASKLGDLWRADIEKKITENKTGA